MRNYRQYIVVFITLCLFLSLVGCGSNLFKNMNLIPETTANQSETINSLLDNARTTADYEAAETKALAIINDQNATTADKKEAYFLKGEALLGKSGVTLTNIASDFANIGKTGDVSNLFSKLEKQATGSVTDAAKALNTSYSLVGGTVDKNRELTRGITNVIAVVDVLNNYYDVDASGNVGDAKDSSTTAKDRVSSLVNDGVLSYASGATTAFGNAGSLDAEQNAQAAKVDTAAQKVTSMNVALSDPTGESFTLSTGEILTINASSPDADVDKVMADIFKF